MLNIPSRISVFYILVFMLFVSGVQGNTENSFSAGFKPSESPLKISNLSTKRLVTLKVKHTVWKYTEARFEAKHVRMK